ncbi:hypothetical protein [Mycolicibacterium baixiangningiae]|uniref:hypothetical protein n=1 Tax=Mycolicibacterium baixiangningiae TaxID=2761578 RepID=UPI0018D1BEF7|nr:hypothetical protein [Mycolicibacterium baixiangningiae]
MKKTYGLAPVALAVGIGAAVLMAPSASAQPNCVTTGETGIGGTTTQCSSPGNTQIVTSPGQTNFLYPWNDYYYGPALVMGW